MGWDALAILVVTAIALLAVVTTSIGPGSGLMAALVCLMVSGVIETDQALSGFANGSEITIPVSILADLINKNNPKEKSTTNASYFGLWQMIEKANLGIAAGVCLPILGVWGYEPNSIESNNFALTVMYSLFPCVIKTFAIITLYYFWIEHDSDKIDT